MRSRETRRSAATYQEFAISFICSQCRVIRVPLIYSNDLELFVFFKLFLFVNEFCHLIGKTHSGCSRLSWVSEGKERFCQAMAFRNY